jgi:hypothetical protein
MTDDAIVGLVQPLNEALNQLASGLWGACNPIEELGRCEEFYVNRAGGSSNQFPPSLLMSTSARANQLDGCKLHHWGWFGTGSCWLWLKIFFCHK